MQTTNKRIWDSWDDAKKNSFIAEKILNEKYEPIGYVSGYEYPDYLNWEGFGSIVSVFEGPYEFVYCDVNKLYWFSFMIKNRVHAKTPWDAAVLAYCELNDITLEA